jgi:hypothetical protein
MEDTEWIAHCSKFDEVVLSIFQFSSLLGLKLTYTHTNLYAKFVMEHWLVIDCVY